MKTAPLPLPLIIQGGMGIGVSGWKLARAVSRRGQLGVVSGTCLDSVLVRRLQDGDEGGHVRRAMDRFPLADVSATALKSFFRPGGRQGTGYRLLPMWKQAVSRAREQIAVLAAFVEVHLAREGHGGIVGMNLLTKVQLPNLSTLFGAMLAGVDYVLMGAGIPREIPGVLDRFAQGEPASLRLDVEGLPRGETVDIHFDPRPYLDVISATAAPSSPSCEPAADADWGEALKRPHFLPIVSSHTLASVLARKASGRVDGFVVEGPTAGGHNAPPRGQARREEANERGGGCDRRQPVYGERDQADLAEMRALGLPFWLAGGIGSPQGLRRALEVGAAGVQVGTLFAYTAESGLEPGLKQRALERVRAGDVVVRTDGRASPTGFPFKVLELPGTNSQPEEYARRERRCDLGYLRVPYRRADGPIDYRCAAEPVDTYVAKGGSAGDSQGRSCLCNALLANIGHAQVTADGPERALLTSGSDLASVTAFLAGRDAYVASDAIDYLLSEPAIAALAAARAGARESAVAAGILAAD